jgi:integrase
MRSYKRLSRAEVNRLVAARQPGMYADGDGLYLSIAKAGTASWTFRYMLARAAHEMGLGPVRDVGLKKARDAAYQARALKRQGTDPLAAKQQQKQGAAVAKAKTMTFAQCAKAYITAHQTGWKNAQHRRQWTASLEAYVYPVFGALPVADIDTGLIMQVLRPIWNDKTETASRLRGRIENILDSAKADGLRDGDNPARWRGHLEHKLPKRSMVAPVQHQPALPYREIAAFMTDLRSQDGADLRALELAILCASRSGEVLEAKWSEFGDLADRVWTIPAERMKMKKEHRVPLSDAALAVLQKQKVIRVNDYVFAGQGEKPAGRSTLDNTLKRRLGRIYYDEQGRKVTVHGFRSTFRDWAGEETGSDPQVVEMALAHTIANKAEAAYRRGDLFKKRRDLMDAWAAYCAGGAEVVSFPAEVRSA